MYIPEFWAGVCSTLFGEVVLLVIALIVSYAKDQNKKR